jgi:hypothetical protein
MCKNLNILNEQKLKKAILRGKSASNKRKNGGILVEE